MHRFAFPPLPQGRAGLALLVTALYATLALVAFYFPISHSGAFVRLFGSPDLARDAMIRFTQTLFWPLAGMLALSAAQELAELLRGSGGKGG